MAVFFVSDIWMKKNTPLCKNVDVDDLYPFVNVAQDKYIKDLLGNNFFNHLKAELETNTLNANEINLLKLIRPCLAYYICVEALPFLSTKIRNKGVMTATSDTANSVGINELKYLRQECLNQAEYYLKIVQKYLCENSNLFPEYNSDNNDIVYPSNRLGSTCDLAFETYLKTDIDFYKKYIKS